MGPHGERSRISEGYGKQPLRWNAKADAFMREHGYRPKVFCASLADIFGNKAEPEWRKDLFDLIRECSCLDWLLLTKRPENISKMVPRDWGFGYHNVWLGITAEDQDRFDQRWSRLSIIGAAVRFVSYERAIGPLRIPNLGPYPGWLISGGESGGGARPMDPNWARDVIRDCRRLGIKPFHKQWGTYRNNPLVVEERMTVEDAKRLDGQGKGGVLVDGKVVREIPTARKRHRVAA
jgi:protein gp37